MIAKKKISKIPLSERGTLIWKTKVEKERNNIDGEDRKEGGSRERQISKK
jgi:hypothetical protein